MFYLVLINSTCLEYTTVLNYTFWTSCQQVVTMLLFYQVATRLSLTTCWQIDELQGDNKLLEQLVTSLKAVNNLSTSWEQAVRTHPVNKLLEQHRYKSAAICYNSCVFTCVPRLIKFSGNSRVRHVKRLIWHSGLYVEKRLSFESGFASNDFFRIAEENLQ
jgi:hypothetical protein